MLSFLVAFCCGTYVCFSLTFKIISRGLWEVKASFSKPELNYRHAACPCVHRETAVKWELSFWWSGSSWDVEPLTHWPVPFLNGFLLKYHCINHQVKYDIVCHILQPSKCYKMMRYIWNTSNKSEIAKCKFTYYYI